VRAGRTITEAEEKAVPVRAAKLEKARVGIEKAKENLRIAQRAYDVVYGGGAGRADRAASLTR
jgi:hypothetical protein